MLVSVIIRTYNEERYLAEVISAIKSCPNFNSEIIVVDSGSTDRTIHIAQDCNAKLLHIQKEDFSFGSSLNVGCKAAQGEILVFLSGHCIPKSNNYLDFLLAPFADPQVAITYGRQVGGVQSRFSEGRVYEKYYPQNQPSQGPAFCNNANSAARKAIWNRFKYDETLTGLEDLALGKKVTESGFRIAYCPEAVVYHLHHESWAQIRRRYEREAIALRHIEPNLHLSLIEAAFYFMTACWFDIFASIRAGKGISLVGEIFHYRFNQFLGSWLGSRSQRELSLKEKAVYFFPA